MSDQHEHDWVDQMYVFPDEPGIYEYDEPYLVQYCTDRECGQRRTSVIAADLAADVRAREGFPEAAEEVN